jgi:hypothetical protein
MSAFDAISQTKELFDVDTGEAALDTTTAINAPAFKDDGSFRAALACVINRYQYIINTNTLTSAPKSGEAIAMGEDLHAIASNSVFLEGLLSLRNGEALLALESIQTVS